MYIYRYTSTCLHYLQTQFNYGTRKSAMGGKWKAIASHIDGD